MTIHTLAGEAYDMFERAVRENGESYTRLKDGAPEWLSDLVYEAHGDMLPDDWRHDAIRSALGAIHEAGEDADLDDVAHEFADGNVDTYGGLRVAWLASNLYRAVCVDEAVEEFGHSDGGIYGDIALGQYVESVEVFASVRDSLSGVLAEREEAR